MSLPSSVGPGVECEYELRAAATNSHSETVVRVVARTTAIVVKWRVTKTPLPHSGCFTPGQDLGSVRIDKVGDTISLNHTSLDVTGTGAIDYTEKDINNPEYKEWGVKVADNLDASKLGQAGILVFVDRRGDDIYDPDDPYSMSWNVESVCGG